MRIQISLLANNICLLLNLIDTIKLYIYLYNLLFFYDNITNGYSINVINTLSITSIIAGVFVITSKNPVISVLFLIGLFFNIGCILIIIGLTFIGLSYLLIYVGAVSILFLFILMLINIRVSELLSATRNSIPLILVVFILVNLLMFSVLPYYQTNITENLEKNYIYVVIYKIVVNNFYYNFFSDTINNTSYFHWDGNIMELNPISVIGNVMYTLYPILLISTSLILLLAMIGVVAITINYNKIKE